MVSLGADISTATDVGSSDTGNPGTGLPEITVSAPSFSPILAAVLAVLIVWALSKGD